MEKGPDEEVLEKGEGAHAQHSEAHGQDEVEPQGMPQAVMVSPAVELGAENARAAGAAEETEVKDKQQLIDDGDAGHGFRADPPYHQVVQQVDKGGNRVLQQQWQRQRRDGPVKLTISDQFFHSNSPVFRDVRPSYPSRRKLSIRCPRS